MPQWQAAVNQDWDTRGPQSSIQFLVHQEGSGCKHSHGALPFTLETEYNRLCKAKWSEGIKGKLAHTVPLSEADWPVHCPTEDKGKHTTGNSMLQDLPIMSIHTPVHDIYLDPPLSLCVLIQRHWVSRHALPLPQPPTDTHTTCLYLLGRRDLNTLDWPCSSLLSFSTAGRKLRI